MRRSIYVIAGAVLGGVLALQVPSLAQDTGPTGGIDRRTVTVTGTATIRSAPDEAVVSLGVQSDANTAQAAMQRNAERMGAVIRALRDLGIRERDLATSNVSLWPTYDAKGTAIAGYQASNQVDVTVRDLGNVGAVIDAAVDAGANLTNGIVFRLSDANRGVSAALTDAVADARGKAETLAAAGDAALGQVVEMIESGSPSYPPIAYGRAMAEDAASTPIQEPTLETQVMVSVTWELV